MSSFPSSLFAVGSYAAADEPGIHLFQFEAGQLTPWIQAAGVINPSFLLWHPRYPWLYAVSETSPGAVWAFRLADAALHPLNQQLTDGDSPCHLLMDRAGRWLIVSHYSSGSVTVLPVLADGSLGTPADRVQHQGHSVHPRQEQAHAHSAVFSPDEQFVFVADLGMDKVVGYCFDAAAGKLRPHSQVDTRPGAGPRYGIFAPGGRSLYMVNELDSTVTLYGYDAAAGQLEARQTIATVPLDAPETIAAHIHFSFSGRRLYVSNRGHNSLATFAVAADGQLTRQATTSCGGKWPRHFTLSPCGRYLLVANQLSYTVAVLPFVNGRETIGPVVGQAAVPQATCGQFRR